MRADNKIEILRSCGVGGHSFSQQYNTANNMIKGRLKRHFVASKNYTEVNAATAYKSTLIVLML